MLNSQVFTSLFAAALACDGEPTFVLSGGSTLSWGAHGRREDLTPTRGLLSAVIGPAGPVAPHPNTPALGMEPEEAWELVKELFERFQDATGLVQVTR
jgi:hypothetical protein